MYKVFDHMCEGCNIRTFDDLVQIDSETGEQEPGPSCPCCGEEMLRLIPAPAGVVYDKGQISSKRALARAYRTLSKAHSYRPGSEERNEAKKEAAHFMAPGTKEK